jgi:hypothetical protein
MYVPACRPARNQVGTCRPSAAASPHTAGHDAHIGGLTWRPALSVIHPAPSYPDRIRGVCEPAAGRPPRGAAAAPPPHIMAARPSGDGGRVVACRLPLLLVLLMVLPALVSALDNGVANTPPRGWCSWWVMD